MSNNSERLANKTRRDPRWACVVSRDLLADNQFYYSVKTTGIYCRPSCGSRTPRPENVNFFSTHYDAEKAGFRPCKRCKPDQAPLAKQQVELIAQLCKQIETAETPPTLAMLAQSAHMSTFHLHRIFKA